MINPEIFIRRQKLRRKFESEFQTINSTIKSAALEAGVNPFFIKYSNHLLDRAIQREIDEEYVFSLFKKLSHHVKEVNEYLNIPEKERPLRLEITDNILWLGMTVDISSKNNFSLKCRMAFINKNRLNGKTSKKVIYLK